MIEDDNFNVTVLLKNQNDVPYTDEIELYGLENDKLDFAEVHLEAGESTTKTLTWQTEVGDGEKTGEIIVRSEDDSDSQTITIEYVEYDLTIKVEGEGTINPSPGNYSFKRGKEVTIRPEPNEGWTLNGWEEDEKKNSIGEEDITIKIEEDREITIIFEKYEEEDISALFFSWIDPIHIIVITILVLTFFMIKNKKDVILRSIGLEKTRSD